MTEHDLGAAFDERCARLAGMGVAEVRDAIAGKAGFPTRLLAAIGRAMVELGREIEARK
jgi:hypothetical protein